MRKRKRKGDYLVVVVWVLLALGWIGAGAVAAQEARLEGGGCAGGHGEGVAGRAMFTVPAGWSVETAKALRCWDAAGNGHAGGDFRCGSSGGREAWP